MTTIVIRIITTTLLLGYLIPGYHCNKIIIPQQSRQRQQQKQAGVVGFVVVPNRQNHRLDTVGSSSYGGCIRGIINHDCTRTVRTDVNGIRRTKDDDNDADDESVVVESKLEKSIFSKRTFHNKKKDRIQKQQQLLNTTPTTMPLWTKLPIIMMEQQQQQSRRQSIRHLLSSINGGIITASFINNRMGFSLTRTNNNNTVAHAVSVPFTNDNNHRQLELCFVTLLRVLYWAENTYDIMSDMNTISSKNDNDDKSFTFEQQQQQKKKLYLETRLCCKALLTGKIGGGATSTVYTLANIQLPSSLNDIEWYISTTSGNNNNKNRYNKKEMEQIIQYKKNIYESIASIVEFDGLEGLNDPSPRSTLTLQQYNDRKYQYILRILKELVIPNCQSLLRMMENTPSYEIAMKYIQQYYASEIYVEPIPITPTTMIQPTATATTTTTSDSFITNDKKNNIIMNDDNDSLEPSSSTTFDGTDY